jgi:hypothetical protein
MQKKIKWGEPIIIDVKKIPYALGHCRQGTTGTHDQNFCANGANTGAQGHACVNGGIAGKTKDCIYGSNRIE